MGKPTERILPDGTKTAYSYNPLGVLSSLTHSRGEEILDGFQYTYDPVGNITGIEKHRVGVEVDSGVFSYAYDPLHRLTEVNADTAAGRINRAYTYDSLGNRLAMKNGNIEAHHEYNTRNQLIKTMEGGVTKEHIYDKRGNLTQVDENGVKAELFTYDTTNMMVGAYNMSKGTVEYAYNGFRGRVGKVEIFTTGVATTTPTADLRNEAKYVLDMTMPYDNLLTINGRTGANIQNFIWGNGLLSASNEGTVNNDAGNASFHYLQDHLGSPVRLVEDGSLSIGNHPMAYDEFGGMVGSVNPAVRQANPFSFTGYQAENVTGRYYAQARYYDRANGRFMAEDPVKDMQNWYGYCANNPLVYVDPSGLVVDAGGVSGSVHGPNSGGHGVGGGVTDCDSGSSGLIVNPLDEHAALLQWHIEWRARNPHHGFPILTAYELAAGVSLVNVGGNYIRDFTVPINKALAQIVATASSYRKSVFDSLIVPGILPGLTTPARNFEQLRWFYAQVNHRSYWDIKEMYSWNRTIGYGTFPGEWVEFYFRGGVTRPDYLGNWTYGYIGRAAGIPLHLLLIGSVYAAPLGSTQHIRNEIHDWRDIRDGFNSFQKERYK